MDGFIGLYSVGDTLGMYILCRNGSLVPTGPDAAPAYYIYDSSGNLVTNSTLSASDHNSKTGFRRGSVVVSSANGFAVGRYTILYTYAISSTNYAIEQFFQIA